MWSKRCSSANRTSGTVAGIVKTEFGTADIPEIAITSATAPGVTHRWTHMPAFAEEVANARVWAGFQDCVGPICEQDHGSEEPTPVEGGEAGD
jgi:hypothetical protein